MVHKKAVLQCYGKERSNFRRIKEEICTNGGDWQEDLHEESSEGVTDVFIFHLKEVVPTLVEKLDASL